MFRENYSQSCRIKPKLDRIYHFWFYLENQSKFRFVPNQLENGRLQSYSGLMQQKSESISPCVHRNARIKMLRQHLQLETANASTQVYIIYIINMYVYICIHIHIYIRRLCI